MTKKASNILVASIISSLLNKTVCILVKMQEARDMKDLDEKVKYLEMEIEKYKKIIVMQQECLFNESKLETFQKCCHCDKVFVNESFLLSHIRRKHGLSPSESEKIEKPRMSEQETQTSCQFTINEEMLLSSVSSLVLGSNKSKSWPDIRNGPKDPKPEWEYVELGKKKKKSLKRKVFALKNKINENLRKISNRK